MLPSNFIVLFTLLLFFKKVKSHACSDESLKNFPRKTTVGERDKTPWGKENLVIQKSTGGRESRKVCKTHFVPYKYTAAL